MENTEAQRAAAERLKSQAGFKKMLGVFAILIAVLILIWALTGQGYFWPAWAILGFAVATAFSAWSAYGPREKVPSQAAIDEEAKKFEE